MHSTIQISNDAVLSNLNRITNQIYKLLPNREENIDWQKPLQTLIIELTGMSSFLPDQKELFSFQLYSKKHRSS
jgi:hypothetical protein